jgi:hypothetical protein
LAFVIALKLLEGIIALDLENRIEIMETRLLLENLLTNLE